MAPNHADSAKVDIISTNVAYEVQPDGKEDELVVNENHILQDREVNLFSSCSLIANKIIGSGIFSTPSTIFKLTGSVGMSLMVWVIGAIIATSGSTVMLEFGSAIPRSGGLKNYLERAFRPELLQTCIYIFYCVFLQVSASNAITFSSFILVAAGVEETTWSLRGLAIGAAVFSVGIHTVAPRIGRYLQDLMTVIKLFTLVFIICSGFAALAGHLRIPKPHNFSNAFKGTTNSGYNIGTALLNVIFSYHGYDNVNAVLSEVPNPVKTLKRSLPISMGSITVLYLLTNIAYFAAVPAEQFRASSMTVAASFFENIFGSSAAARVLPSLVALSALGHLLGIAFTVPRLIQELAKNGVMPFSNILMENRPFKTPVAALALHLGVTILFICAPPAGDAFNFVVSMSSYPTTVIQAAVTVGLIKLRLSKNSEWKSPYSAPWITIAIFLAGNIFLIIMPLVRPPNGKGNTSLPYWLSSVVPLAILSLGIVYYTIRFQIVPRLFGYRHRQVEVELADGSKVIRFKRYRVEGS